MKCFVVVFFVFGFFPVQSQNHVMILNDEFNTHGFPDSTKWDYETGKLRNAELQYYKY